MKVAEKMSAIQKSDWVNQCVTDIDDADSEVAEMLVMFADKHQLRYQGDAKVEAISKLLIANAVQNWVDPESCGGIALTQYDLAVFEIVARTICVEMTEEKENILMKLILAEYLQNILGSDVSFSHLSSANH